MRVVIDTNRLASDELRGFLSLSSDNRAILIDYVTMERFKPNNLTNLDAGLAVLRDFPGQVVALKSTGEVCQLDPGQGAMAEAMINRDETDAFSDFCRYVRLAAEGHVELRRQLEQRVQWAQDQMDVVLRGASTFGAEMAEFTAPFTANELAQLRRNEPMTLAMSQKFFGLINAIVRRGFEIAPVPITPPDPKFMADHFMFRNTLCTAVSMLSFARRGMAERRPDRARNDVVDVLVATYGTYFNGVMSEDARTNELQHVTRQILSQIGAMTGPDYVPDYMMKVVDFMMPLSEA